MQDVGAYAWSVLHHAVESLPCSTCAEAGKKMMRGLHDLVNVHLDKPVKHPEDLLWLRDSAADAVRKAGLNPKHLKPTCPKGKCEGRSIHNAR